jgi:hypothetical protein
VPDTTIVALFAGQAARVPNATAVIVDDTTVTYRELGDRVEAMTGCCVNLQEIMISATIAKQFAAEIAALGRFFAVCLIDRAKVTPRPSRPYILLKSEDIRPPRRWADDGVSFPGVHPSVQLWLDAVSNGCSPCC